MRKSVTFNEEQLAQLEAKSSKSEPGFSSSDFSKYLATRRATPYLIIIDKDMDPSKASEPRRNEPTVSALQTVNEPRRQNQSRMINTRRRLDFLTSRMKIITLIYFSIFIIMICVTVFTPSLGPSVYIFLIVLIIIYCFSYFVVFVIICTQYQQKKGEWTTSLNAVERAVDSLTTAPASSSSPPASSSSPPAPTTNTVSQ